MLDDQHEYEKILFRFYSEVLGKETVETMWALTIDKEKGYYKMDNIPFYAPMIASDDIVFAEYDETEGRITYRRTIEASGNSTIQVVVTDETQDVATLRATFKEVGCESEGTGAGYFVVEIPAQLDYSPIRAKLEQLKYAGIIDYGEPYLSCNHQY
ncbi:MAG: DUF4265 domain-containing protein [Chitinophaga sp.]|uniref:DUF4265 domain-containing protein n=1 Tax=Chitinophaga sp. TaxID=1869181 RepID=UPI001B218C2C|nr:DUF4265 domain-containing protein [Chitinophaga sp.]MBO9727946.1 DUF4265 domain-containing protein [Chitinophaga sp.]